MERQIVPSNSLRVPDPYRRYERATNPRIQQWLANQLTCTKSILRHSGSRGQIKRRLRELFNQGSLGAPEIAGGSYFFEARKKGQELRVVYVQEGIKGRPRVLINPHTLCKNVVKQISMWSPSLNGEYVAYSLSNAADNQASLYVMNVKTGRKLSGPIPGRLYPAVYAGIQWKHDSSGFWYCRASAPDTKNGIGLLQKLYFHKLGTRWIDDIVVYDQFGPGEYAIVDESRDGRYLLLCIERAADGEEYNELLLLDNRRLHKGFCPVITRVHAVFSPLLHDNDLYILTNHDCSRNKIIKINLRNAHKGLKAAKIIIPAGRQTIENMVIIGRYLFVLSVGRGSVLRQYTLRGRHITDVPIPELGHVDTLDGDYKELTFLFSSFLVPPIVYRYHAESRVLRVFKEVISEFDANPFRVRQDWYISHDGKRVPMYMVYKQGLRRDGNNPVLLHAYGGFGDCTLPEFDRSIIPFLEAGGIYAIANIRGGGELGHLWHKAAIKQFKHNSFNDFLAAAEWLIAQGYTQTDKLAATGWSNGGLVVGVAITKRPDLFRAVVMGVPVLDMLRFHHFDRGTDWIPEYGDPRDPEMFEYLRQYSPYHNIQNGVEYPACLIVTAEQDDRVHNMHAFKMAARLQKANASAHPILLLQLPGVGHDGAYSVRGMVQQEGDILSFIFDQLKMKYPTSSS